MSRSKLTVLVAEDQGLVALSLEQMLGDLGHHVIGPVSTLPALLQAIDAFAFDVGLLDITLRDGEEVYPAADVLNDRAIPFAFMTAHYPDVLAKRYLGRYIISKPFSWDQMVDCLDRLATHLHAGNGLTSVRAIP